MRMYHILRWLIDINPIQYSNIVYSSEEQMPTSNDVFVLQASNFMYIPKEFTFWH
jgi:hypothetical protein